MSTEVNGWYESLKEQALERNDKSVAIWTKYKSDLEVTKSLLSLLPKKVKHDVMVPIGPKALMRGKIVHTNEFLVNLGETWFVKRTAHQTEEICNRRIKTCEEMLEKLEKERELVVNKSTLPAEQEAFGSEERPEIVEYVTEEENEEWKKQHRIKEREYRQKLAELREKEKKPIETESDLWKHLDELELQEELEDELNRLNADGSSEDDDAEENLESSLNDTPPEGSSSENPEKVDEPKCSKNENLVEESNKPVNESKVTDSKSRKRVSFACDLESPDDEPLRLEITHSDVEPITSENSSEIISPSDIYDQYVHSLNKSPLSVLKININPNKEKELESMEVIERLNCSKESESGISITTGVQLNDVVERNSSNKDNSKTVDDKPKKVSRFRTSRVKNFEWL